MTVEHLSKWISSITNNLYYNNRTVVQSPIVACYYNLINAIKNSAPNLPNNYCDGQLANDKKLTLSFDVTSGMHRNTQPLTEQSVSFITFYQQVTTTNSTKRTSFNVIHWGCLRASIFIRVSLYLKNEISWLFPDHIKIFFPDCHNHIQNYSVTYFTYYHILHTIIQRNKQATKFSLKT